MAGERLEKEGTRSAVETGRDRRRRQEKGGDRPERWGDRWK